MRAYVTTLAALALLGAVMGMLSPEGDIKKYVRLVSALCLLVALASPVISFVTALAEGDWLNGEELGFSEQTADYENVFEEALRNGSASVASDALTAELIQRFDLPDGSLSARVVLADGDECSLSLVRVTLRAEAIFADPAAIIEYVNESLHCPCEVVYE